MTRLQIQQVLQEAAKLPAPQGRRVLAALQAKAAAPTDDYLEEAAGAMLAAMEAAALAEIQAYYELV